MIHKHTGRWMRQGSASVVSWNWEKCSCHSKLVSTLSILLSSVLFWRVSQAWNPRKIPVSPDTWSLWLSQAFIRLLWPPCWCRWCCLPSAWSIRHWSPCWRQWSLYQDDQLILPVLLPLLLSHRCHQLSEDWWLFCLQCWQRLRDLMRRLSWSFTEICWRGWVRIDIPVGPQLMFGTSLLCCRWRGLHWWSCHSGVWWLG